MRVLVQWARRDPGDWEEIDSTTWANLPKRPLPDPALRALADADKLSVGDQGWVNRLNVQGVEFTADHYAVEPLPGRACKVTVWNDDPVYPPDNRFAQEWTFRTLAPDPVVNVTWNTRQSWLVYAEPVAYDLWTRCAPYDIGEVRSWEEFVPPPEHAVRHGIWMSDELYQAHEAIHALRSWQEWTEGVPASEVHEGRVALRRLKIA